MVDSSATREPSGAIRGVDCSRSGSSASHGALAAGHVDEHDPVPERAAGAAGPPGGGDGDRVGADRVVRLGQRDAGVGRQVARLAARLDQEQPWRLGAELVVPVPDREAGVQDRVDLAVLARPPPLRVAFADLVRRRLRVGAGEAAAGGEDGTGVPGHDRAGQAAGGAGQHPWLPGRRQHPDRRVLVVAVRVRLGPGRGEQQRAVRPERRRRLALLRPGQPDRLAAVERHLPERRDIPAGLPVEPLHGGDQPRAVLAQRQSGDAGQGDKSRKVRVVGHTSDATLGSGQVRCRACR